MWRILAWVVLVIGWGWALHSGTDVDPILVVLLAILFGTCCSVLDLLVIGAINVMEDYW
jgi:hypothetical protein